MNIGDLFVALGIKVKAEDVSKANNVIKNLRRNLLEIKIVAITATYGIDKFIEGTLNATVALQNLNNQTGLSISKLQQWQQAGKLADITLTPEQISESISNLEMGISKIKRGAGNIAPFQMLGIDIQGKDAFDVLNQLRENIKGLDNATATGLIQELGLNRGFINILQLTREEFEKLGENVFLNKQQRKSILDYGTALTKLQLRFRALKDQAIAKISPYLTDFIDKFFKWLIDNGDAVVDTISSMVRIFGDFLKVIGNSIALINEFIESAFGMENGLKALSLSFALLSISISPVVASLLTLLLILDDIKVWQSGGKSVIGELLDTFEKLGGFKGLLGGDTIIDFLSDVFGWLDKITEKLQEIGNNSFLKSATIGGAIGSVIPGVGTIAGSLAGGTINIGSKLGSYIADKINDVLDKRAGITNNITQNIYGTSNAEATGEAATKSLINTQSQLQ